MKQAQAAAVVEPSPPHADSAAALLESAPVAIYHTDACGNLLYDNPEYRRFTDRLLEIYRQACAVQRDGRLRSAPLRR